MPRIALIDYGVGNLRSVAKALQRVGAEVQITREAAAIPSADKLVLPGVGSFGKGMGALKAHGLIDPILEAAAGGKPLLGICLGMQLLLESSEEMGQHEGLGIVSGEVRRFPDGDLKVPHTGWNQLTFDPDNPLLDGLQTGSYAYFNHSYYCDPAPSATAAETLYGVRFASALRMDRIYGVQFHPEKSQHVGLQILANFLEAG